jgi:hypothetical protein
VRADACVRARAFAADSIESTVLRSGSFFRRADEQVAVLRSTAPLRTLPHFRRPVLFVNGSRDHRDIEHDLLDAVTSGAAERVRKLSRLIVYSEADHFLANDSRFMDQFALDLLGFVHACLASSSTALALG